MPTTFNKAAVVIAYGSDGLAPIWKDEIENHARGLATNGILALIPEYLASPPALSDDDSANVFSAIPARHAEWARVLGDAVDAAKLLPEIDPSRIGLIGFSLGGFLALRNREAVKAVVEYFAPFKFPASKLFGPPALEGIGASTNRSLLAHIHHGSGDALVPMAENADPIERTLKVEGVTVTRTNYADAVHGFLGDGVNKTAREESRKATIDFLRRYLT